MEDLKTALYSYKDIDNEMTHLSRQLGELRSKRKEQETILASILARPEFASIHRLDISEDKSYITIQRPNAWTKPWSLSKRDLDALLTSYFESTPTPTSTDCFDFICAQHKKVSKEFAFDRVVRKNE